MLPNSVAGVLAREPPNLPTAVRAAATMTMSSIFVSSKKINQALALT
jgi:hypothetical protein